MNQIGNVGIYPFLAEPFHCDFTNHLFYGHLGNHLLNAADYHSDDRDFGMRYLMPIHKTWVLSRLVIEMNEMPLAYDQFYVETWVDSVIKFFTSRNFKVTDGADKVYGYGKSTWVMIDTDSRKPTNILDLKDGAILQYLETQKECPIDPVSRVNVKHQPQVVKTIDTHYSDVDMNGHLNSVKYMEHVLDLWDVNWYRKYHVQRMEIAYSAEAHGGDQLKLYVEEVNVAEFRVSIYKINNDITDETEVCRSRVVFAENQS
ncbi:MAG: acyl-ACP thioesterase domain-containing protein [Prevotella sp.]